MKKSLTVLLLTFFVIFLLRLAGFTYGYYAANVIGNTYSNSLSVSSKYLAVEYLDGSSIMNFQGDYLFPGDSAEKTFYVKNTGTDAVVYNILIENVVNDFERTQDLKFNLYINNELVNDGAINTNETQYLYSNKQIAANNTDTVKFVFEYATTDEIQNIDMNKQISFKFNIDGISIKNTDNDDGHIWFVNNNNFENSNNYRVYGNTIQNGIPTPDEEVEIEGVGNKVIEGNLFDKNLSQILFYNKYVRKNGYAISGEYWNEIPLYTGQTLESGTWFVTAPIRIKPNTTYNYSGFPSGNNPGFFFLEGNKETLIPGAAIKGSGEIITPENAEYIVLSVNSSYFDTMIIKEGEITDTNKFDYIIPLKTSGKNLFDPKKLVIKEDTTGSYPIIAEIKDNDNFVVYPKYASDKVYYSYYANKDVNLTFSYETTENEDYYGYVWADINGETKYNIKSGRVFELKEGDNLVIRFAWFPWNNDNYNRTGEEFVTFSNVQLEEGNVVTDYESPVMPNVEIIKLNESLKKIGNYADYIDFKKQKVVRNIECYEFMGTESFDFLSNNIFSLNNFVDSNVVLGLSNYYIQNENQTDIETNINHGEFILQNNDGLSTNLFLKNSNYSDVLSLQSDLKTLYLEGNPLKFCYPLNKPIEEPIKLPNLSLFNGSNLFELKSKVKSTVSIEY